MTLGAAFVAALAMSGAAGSVGRAAVVATALTRRAACAVTDEIGGAAFSGQNIAGADFVGFATDVAARLFAVAALFADRADAVATDPGSGVGARGFVRFRDTGPAAALLTDAAWRGAF